MLLLPHFFFPPRQSVDPSREYVFLKDSCQIVRPVAPGEVPTGGMADHVVLGTTVAFLEVVDLMASKVHRANIVG
jgi:hypothetical protein